MFFHVLLLTPWLVTDSINVKSPSWSSSSLMTNPTWLKWPPVSPRQILCPSPKPRKRSMSPAWTFYRNFSSDTPPYFQKSFFDTSSCDWLAVTPLDFSFAFSMLYFICLNHRWASFLPRERNRKLLFVFCTVILNSLSPVMFIWHWYKLKSIKPSGSN